MINDGRHWNWSVIRDFAIALVGLTVFWTLVYFAVRALS